MFAESNVLANRRTDLDLHVFFHFSLKILSVSHDYENIYQNEGDYEQEKCSLVYAERLTLWNRDASEFLEFSAFVWLIFESGANSLENVIRSKTSSECLRVDGQAWVDIVTEFLPFLEISLKDVVIVLGEIISSEGACYTLVDTIDINIEGLHNSFRAVLSNAVLAKTVGSFNVFEVSCSLGHMSEMLIVLVDNFIGFVLSKIENAILTKIFEEDFSTIEIDVIVVLHGAKFTIGDAVLLLELGSAMWTSPGNESWLEVHVINDWLDVGGHVSDKVEGSVIARSIPVVGGNLIGVGDLDKELSNQCGRFILLDSFLVTLLNLLLSLNNVILKFLTILLVDKHSWNSNTKTGSIIGEDHVRHIFIS